MRNPGLKETMHFIQNDFQNFLLLKQDERREQAQAKNFVIYSIFLS